MAHLIENSFSQFALLPDEELQGSIYTITQLQVLQNQIAMCAEELLALELDPEHPLQYVKQEAFKRGQIEILQYLVMQSATVQQVAAEDQLEPDSEF